MLVFPEMETLGVGFTVEVTVSVGFGEIMGQVLV
jgi:hypothetical protein